MICKIQRSWRQFYDVIVTWSYQTYLETAKCGSRVSFRRPFTPNSSFAYVLPRTGWVGAAKLTLSPGAGSTIGTPLSDKSRYQKSKLLTTFTIPNGRFCFNRLPFGISLAPEHFQRQILNVLEGFRSGRSSLSHGRYFSVWLWSTNARPTTG